MLKRIFLAFVLTFFVKTTSAQHAGNVPCPPQGNSKLARLQALDFLKNRADAPEKIDGDITLARILAPGNDADRWDSSESATITGYVVLVKSGAKESCNCDDAALLDTHIMIGLTPDADPSDCMVCEVTPRWRVTNPSWTTANLRKTIGKKITITGWMLFDAEHANASTNTAKRGAKCWRATAWEVHPVTAIDESK